MENNLNDDELIYSIREVGKESKEILFKKYEPLIHLLAFQQYKKQAAMGIDVEDFIQEGYIGLNNAVDTYDPSIKTLFHTYAYLCIKRKIQLYIRKFYREKEIKNYKYYEYSDSSYLICDGSDKYMEKNYYYEEIIKLKHSVSFIRSCVFELRYNGFSYKEIAKLLDIKEKEVDRHLSKFRQFLRSKKFDHIFS